jgi:cytochrome c oxidase subunit 3
MTSIQADPADHAHDHGHDDHGHGHDPHLAHHFESMEQQFDSGKLGMWLFLATEVLFFGGLFAAYVVLRSRSPEVFSYASHYLDTMMGGINTCVLIASSLTMALAVRYAQTGKKWPLVFCLWLTMGGAVGFLVIKYFEYTHKFHENLVWGTGFYNPVDEQQADDLAQAEALLVDPILAAKQEENAAAARTEALASLVNRPEEAASSVATAALGPAGLSAPIQAEQAAIEEADTHDAGTGHGMQHLSDPEMPVNTHLFFAIYFCMTGLHGIHVVIGMGVIGWLIWRAQRGEFGPKYFTPVDLGGLYWHIVDLIWIFLFPLFYLIH